MNYPVYVLLVGGLVGTWMLVLFFLENSLAISVVTVVIMGLLIGLVFYYNADYSKTDE
jgi:VIT1/CCC1 family predicted Fe2+/Mn2+ transporter